MKRGHVCTHFFGECACVRACVLNRVTFGFSDARTQLRRALVFSVLVLVLLLLWGRKERGNRSLTTLASYKQLGKKEKCPTNSFPIVSHCRTAASVKEFFNGRHLSVDASKYR